MGAVVQGIGSVFTGVGKFFGAGKGSSSGSSAPVEPPPPPPVPPSVATPPRFQSPAENTIKPAGNQTAGARATAGLAGTIITSPEGLKDSGSVSNKQLLGQ